MKIRIITILLALFCGPALAGTIATGWGIGNPPANPTTNPEITAVRAYLAANPEALAACKPGQTVGCSFVDLPPTATSYTFTVPDCTQSCVGLVYVSSAGEGPRTSPICGFGRPIVSTVTDCESGTCKINGTNFPPGSIVESLSTNVSIQQMGGVVGCGVINFKVLVGPGGPANLRVVAPDRSYGQGAFTLPKVEALVPPMASNFQRTDDLNP